MARSRSLIDVVERTYALEGSEREWLAGILSALPQQLDRGFGVAAYRVDLGGPIAARLGTGEVVGSAELKKFVRTVAGGEGREARYRDTMKSIHTLAMRRAKPFDAISELLSAHPRVFAAWLSDPLVRTAGMRDYLVINSIMPPDPGIVIGVPLRRQEGTNKHDRARFSMVASHLAAAFRLREHLARGHDSQEAVFTPDGVCLHAEKAARSRSVRDRLREGVKSIDRARGALRHRDELEALQLWRGLWSGRWSLVDRFDSDGRRFVVARRNDPRILDPRQLSEREKQVVDAVASGWANKQIAFELGISTSAVAFHLQNAMRKLGAASRTELIAMVRQLGTADPGDRETLP